MGATVCPASSELGGQGLFSSGGGGGVLCDCLLLPHPPPQKHMEAYVSDCYDSIAVFLCIHVVLRFKAIVAKRNVPAIDR